ncbi:hypothetical protein HHL11_09550 [Ramlibacter sp. G-1-2-2]|uniref:Uncharacterized protein n=1 Tax=Ramlibacter agri TaxID=2728837 RepID=A0A848H5Y9_9BURK|nr:hypothetical protein [Ramlibacter agri]NML43993.1 hypothetical protein [Ramlibacter agri]
MDEVAWPYPVSQVLSRGFIPRAANGEIAGYPMGCLREALLGKGCRDDDVGARR